jgi:hypothetical protein
MPGQLPHDLRNPGVCVAQPLPHRARVGEHGHHGVHPRPRKPVDAELSTDAVELLGGEPAVELAGRAAETERIRGDRAPAADQPHPPVQ